MGQLLADWFKTQGREDYDDQAVDKFAFEVSKHAMLAATEFTRKSIDEMPNVAGDRRQMAIMVLAFSKALFTYLALQRMNLSTCPGFAEAVIERVESRYQKEYAATSQTISQIWHETDSSATQSVMEGSFNPLSYLNNRMRALPDPGMNLGRSPIDHIARIIARRFFSVRDQPDAYRAMKKVGYLIGARFMVQM